ncbi:MAG: hypothetical protein ACHQ17_10780 [Polyangia bacterium]|jgi:hypothetical protein
METREFETLLAICAELAGLFPDGIVFIGGIAVYLHTKNVRETSELAELTHDADFYISLADMGDLRDLEEVTANRRLSKHQLIKRGFEFDIYTERQAALIVPYDVVRARSVVWGDVRVASLEHLLVLKLEAFLDRKGSAKGDKDAMDLIRIAAAAVHGPHGFQPDLALPYLRDEHFGLLERVERGPYAIALAHGNAKSAKGLRQDLSGIVAQLGPASSRRRR